MADIAQLIATGGTALVSAAAGAGLTYWLGALNRRHQETREDRTRWYEERLRAYLAFHQAVEEAFFRMGTSAQVNAPLSAEEVETLIRRLVDALGAIHLVGSPEVTEGAEKTVNAALDQMNASTEGRTFSSGFLEEFEQFRDVARKDLGHPNP